MTQVEAPETLEGWYVQHDGFNVRWPQWRALPAEKQASLVEESAAWLRDQVVTAAGSSAVFSLVGHKGDLLLTHFRPGLESLNQVKFGLRQLDLFAYLEPTYGYLSVIELGMYEIVGAVQRKLAASTLEPHTAAYDDAYQQELQTQKEAMHDRLFPDIPPGRYICFYPMSKKRGETHNWYALSMDERRQMMRGHGMVGRKYAGRVKQIVSGSVGLDDWEWGVSLFSDDPLVFKKLVYEMRFDAASAYYALFGEFFVGVRFEPEDFGAFMSGTLTS
jgi:hydrogen peroxide-dependent heme synthase